MRYLLDTQVLLWWRQDDPRLPHRWDSVFRGDGGDEILFSLVSIWEIAIKRSLGKLRLDGSLADFTRTLETGHGFVAVTLQAHEICRLENLERHHRDPFDRLLIAQCIEAGATAVTADARWRSYPLRVDF